MPTDNPTARPSAEEVAREMAEAFYARPSGTWDVVLPILRRAFWQIETATRREDAAIALATHYNSAPFVAEAIAAAIEAKIEKIEKRP